MAVSCVDLSEINTRIDNLEKRLSEHETLAAKTYALKTAVEALEKNVYVESVTNTADGYVIKFTNNKEITIKNGKDGQDATAPTVGVKEVDGALVWTVNDEVVKDASGKPVPATVSVPEFKFDNNKWWYRFGEADTWKDCGEKEGPEPSISETEGFVIISIGDNTIAIAKEVVAPSIEAINPVLLKANRLFIPIGKSVDLKDWFEVAPEGALKALVTYTPAVEDAPFTISEDGILEATGAGSTNVIITAKNNPELTMTITIRTAKGGTGSPKVTVKPEQKIDIYKGSLEEYNQQLDFGGSTSFNPFNNAIAGVFNGTLNFRIGMPVITNPNITMENGRLHFMLYIYNTSVLTPAPFDGQHFLEHTSAGTFDANEVDWDLMTFVPDLKNGWNEIDLALSDVLPNDGTYDPTNANFIRFVCTADTKNAWVSYQMKNLFVYASDLVPVTEIKPVITSKNQLFVPKDKTLDLKEFFEVGPEGALKSMVTFTPEDGAPFTVSEDGILTPTGAGSNKVFIASKDNPDVQLSIVVRTADCPNNDVPARAIDPENKHILFEGSLDEYNALIEAGSTTAWNQANNSFGGIYNGTWNWRFGVPSQTFPELTMENGHLHFMFYVADVSLLHPVDLVNDNFLEFSSSGTWDVDEIDWDIRDIIAGMKNGWNEIDLKFSDAVIATATGTFDPTKPNFVRIKVNADTGGAWSSFQFKDFFVYAAEEAKPLTVSEMLSLEKGAEIDAAECLVTAVTSRGFVVSDGAKAIYVYTQGGNFNDIAKIGDKVTFKGSKTVFNGVHEVEKVSALTVISSGNAVTYPDATDITANAADYTASEAEFISLEGTLKKSGSYYNITIDGIDAASKQGSIVYPTADLGADALDGKKINVTGYFNGFSSGTKYLNIIATKVEEVVPVQITIDGDMSDWANVKGVTNPASGATYLEFKMASDENNIYFYTKRVANSALWNGGGYLYYAMDYDNDPTTGKGDIWDNKPYECIFVIWPFAGSGDAPAFAEKPLGESMMKPSGTLANYNANGKANADGVELEFSIPRADFPTLPDTEITVYSWGNKSGENMKSCPLKIKF